jgi:hypothetical protein
MRVPRVAEVTESGMIDDGLVPPCLRSNSCKFGSVSKGRNLKKPLSSRSTSNPHADDLTFRE